MEQSVSTSIDPRRLPQETIDENKQPNISKEAAQRERAHQTIP